MNDWLRPKTNQQNGLFHQHFFNTSLIWFKYFWYFITTYRLAHIHIIRDAININNLTGKTVPELWWVPSLILSTTTATTWLCKKRPLHICFTKSSTTMIQHDWADHLCSSIKASDQHFDELEVYIYMLVSNHRAMLYMQNH